MVEVVGSVGVDEVPQGQRRLGPPGKWTALAEQILADYDQRRVTVLKVADKKELMAVRNGLSNPLRREGKRLRTVVVRQGAELRVFCELVLREPEPERQNGVT